MRQSIKGKVLLPPTTSGLRNQEFSVVPHGGNFLEVCPVELTRNLHCRVLGKASPGLASHVRRSTTKPPKKWKVAGCWLLLATVHCRKLVLEKGQMSEAGKAVCSAGAGCWETAHAAGAWRVSTVEPGSNNNFPVIVLGAIY